jgi:hypothetical protein
MQLEPGLAGKGIRADESLTPQYSLTVPVVLWRIIVPRYRTWLLYRIVLFLGCRLAMLIIRVIMATTSSWSLGLLSA